MRPDSALSIPRFGFGLLIGLVSIGAMVVGACTTWFMGGTQASIMLVAGALAAGLVVSLLPAVLTISADFWGVVVLGAGVGRGLLVMGIVFVATENNPDLSSKPIFMGALVGTVLVLVAETAAAVTILSGLERVKAALKASPQAAMQASSANPLVNTGSGSAPKPAEHA